MKTNYFKAIFLLVSFLTASSSFSQSSYSDKFPKWRLGLNMGGTWQSNDLSKNKAGLAGGFNIERILNRKEEALVGFSLGFRFLGGNSYGLDNNRNIALKSNTVLNGTIDTTLNYFKSPGYFYNNYKTKHGEGAFELKMNFPKFEKRTNIVFHLWGGIGVATYSTKINALNGDTMYNFSNIASQPSIGNLQSFYDKSYETVADGSSASVASSWAPSCGFGLGYRFSKNVALVFEHKFTFPRVDVIDGQQWKDDNTRTGNNDFYHYTAAHLIFTIYGRAHSSSSTYNNTTNTNVNTQTNLNNSPKPIINVYTPITNPHTTTSNIQQVSGTIKYVTSYSGVSITVNGVPLSNFDFNPNNGSFGFNTNLNPGINNITITGTNSAGQDSETIQVNYSASQFTSQPIVTELPPKVIINYPSNNYVSSLSNTNVNSVISNVSSSANIAISVNGVAISNFNFNSFSGALVFNAPLNVGNNSIIVSAFNTAGNDAKQVFVKYAPTSTQAITPKGEPKPIVSFHNPSSTPYESSIRNFNVTAHVTNVTSASQLNVVCNGVQLSNFTFNQYGFLNFNLNLNVGSNSIIITGTNTAGSDTKSATINFKETGLPPIVNIVEPSQNPFVTEAASSSVVAKIENVQSQSNITIMQNNIVVPFIYNTSNQTATIQASLNAGKNTIIVSAVNSFGSDSKTQIIERTIKVMRKPAVTIINPAVSPFNTFASSQQVTAQIRNVASASEILVKDQSNQVVLFSYDAIAQQITFVANLNVGANNYNVSATNSAGSDSKVVVINYTKKSTPILEKPPVVTFVNPSQTPYSTFDPSINVIATVTNISSQQGIVVKLNNTAVNFTFNSTTNEVVIPSSLDIGSNTIIVTATNLAGNDAKTQLIERKQSERCLLSPVVKILVPSVNPFNTFNAAENVRAEVLNVTGASSIQVTNQSGQLVNFTYDVTSHYINFTANLIAGSNLFKVKATNSVDAVTETATIIYTKIVTSTQTPIKVNKPVVSFTVPSQVNNVLLAPTQSVSATVTNVNDISGVSVQVNGQASTSFAFNNGVVTFVLNCNIGNNTVSITGTNAAGTDSKTIFVNRTEPEPVIPLPVVTFINPSSLNSITTSSSQSIQTSVLNVLNASQVLVQVNGIAVTNFVYLNGNITFNANLNVGNNVVFIKGTNASGSDSKTITITYEKPEPPVVVNPPVLSYLIPSGASMSTVNSNENIRMSVTNVTLNSQISIKLNGNNISNFTLSHGVINFNAILSLGLNTIVVVATNNGGSDTKQIVVNYELPRIPAPLVTIINPAVTSATSISNQAVEATVTNVTSASQILVTLNGTAFSGFSYTNGNVSFVASLVDGANNIVITGTNVSGSDSKTVVVNYSQQTVVNDPKIRICHYPNGPTSTPIAMDILASEWPNHEAHGDAEGNCPVVSPPVVTMINPSIVNTTTLNSVQAVSANITNVTQFSQVSVTLNNSPITNFSFSNGTVNFTAVLNIGLNTVKITGTNNGGIDSKTITFTRQAPPAPSVSISIPSTNPYISATAIVNVTASVLNVAGSSEISVTKGGVAVPFNYSAVDNSMNFTYTLTGNATFVITASNSNGSDSKSLVVNYTEPVVDPQITICHKPPGNPTNTQELTIPQSAWAAHQAHGDVLGTCPPPVVTPTVTPDPEIVICHKPPGNPTNTQQLTIPQSAWAAHEAHGDVLGTCPVVLNPPEVSIVNPSSVNSTTQNNVQTISAVVTNVSNASQVSVLFNNSPITNFTFTNGNVSFNTALSLGSNTVKVTGTNDGGTDSKTITITRQAPPAPTVSITNPSANPYASGTANLSVTANVANVAYASEINVTANGSTVPFNYNVANDRLTLDYVLTGNTTFVISASNANGSDSRSLVVNYTVPVVDPEIVICHKPPGNPTNTQQLTIPQSAWPAHQAHGDDLGACPPPVTTPTVETTPDPEIVICHKPPGNPTNTQQLTIPQSAWPAHQAHGDDLGACPTPTVTPNNENNNGGGNNNANNGGGNNKTITICHIPPGNNANPQQITIPESAWPAHEAHGDSKGNCPTVQNVGGGKGGNNNSNGNKDNKDNTPGTILNGIKGLMTPKTNTNTQPINNTPKTNTNKQPTNTTPKTTEPKKEEPKVTPRTVQPTATTPAAPVKTTTPSTVTEEKGTSTPRVIKPR